jgi:hypothetical protein
MLDSPDRPDSQGSTCRMCMSLVSRYMYYKRLFSQVGIAFSAKRKRAEKSDTLEDIMFSRWYLP